MKEAAPLSGLIPKVAAATAIATLVPLHAFALSLTRDHNLDFGKFIAGSGYSGTVTVTASGARSASGTVRVLGTVASPAKFTITGAPLQPYYLTVPTVLTLSSDRDSMEVTALTTSVPLTGELPSTGTLSFFVGGTLIVKSTQGNASYAGNIDITLNGK